MGPVIRGDRAPDPGPIVEDRRIAASWPVAVALGAASWAAGLIHLAFMREHLEEYVPFGAFFLVSGVFQVVWAVIVFGRRSRAYFVLGLVANAAFAILWAITRTVGLPIGPEHWTAEVAGVADVAATVLEVALTVGCGWTLLRDRAREGGRPASTG